MKTVSYVVLVTDDEMELIHTNSRYNAEKRARAWKRQHPDHKVQIAIRREVLRAFGYYTSPRDAYAAIRDMQAEDVKHGDADNWLYNVEIVETVTEYPVPREPEKGEA